MTHTLVKWTIADYHQMIEAGILGNRRAELLNGEIVEMPSEGAPHAGLITRTAEYLRELLGYSVLVREGHPITLPSSNSEPEPDIAIVARSPSYYMQRHPYPEDIFWLIEFSNSSLQKDLDSKAKIYAAAGIAEYWVVNFQARKLVVMRDSADGEYRSQVDWQTGTIEPLGFAGVAVEVDRILP